MVAMQISTFRRYGLATIACGLALAVARPLDAPSSCFFLAVMVSSLYGGRGPGLFSALISALAFDYFFLPSRFELTFDPSSLPRFLVFLGATLLVVTLVEMKRRAEASRREIHAEYRTIADTAPDAIITIDQQGQILFVNPAASRIFGWGAPEMIGQPLAMLLPQFRLEQHQLNEEWTGRRSNGMEFSTELSFGEIAGRDQKTFTVFIRDISERKRAQAALGKSESYLASAQRLSRTGSFGWNLETGALHWSEETYRILGYEAPLVPTLDLVLQRIHPDDNARVQESLARAVRDKEPFNFEHRLLMPDGSVKHLQILSTPVASESGTTEYVGAVMDITASKHTEIELRRSEEYLEEAQRLSHTGSWVWDVNLPGPAYWSTELYRMARRDPAQGPPTIEEDRLLHPPEDWAGLIAAADNAVRSRSGFEYDSRFAFPDGSYKNIHIVGHPVLNDAGEVLELVGTTIDVTEQFQARAALEKAFAEVRRSEDRLRVIVNTIPTLAWSTRPDGSALFFNQRWLDYTGLSTEQALDFGWRKAIHPDDASLMSDYWRSILASGEPGEIEARLRRFDGEYRWFLFRANPLRDDSGNVVKWYGTNTDIEDRKRAEEALRGREHSLRLIVDSIPGLLCTNTAAGDVELVNQTLLNYTGKSLEELKNWTQAVHPGDLPAVASLWARSVETGHPFNVEVRVRRADGIYRWFHCRGLPVRDSENRIVRWYNLLTDIEDRQQAEEALRERERDLALIIETIPALVWCAAPAGELTYVNERVQNYTGTTLAALAESGWVDFLHPDDVERTLRAWTHAVATGEQHEVQYRLRRGDGAYRWFHVLGQPVRDQEGQVIRWYGLLIDIEDSKNAEETLRETQERLSRASQVATVGELAASIAHEVNQPLSAVVANGHACLRWLLADPPNLAKAQQAAERIVRDGKDAGEVVRRIRALFKGAPLEKVPLDLNEVIGEVVDLLRGETARKRVFVETSLETELAPVVGDRVQLQQLILNLLLNGIEAMEPVVNRPRKLAIRTLRQNAETALVEIRDCGVGLEDPEKVFEAFFTTKENGMGMGLAICRSIVDAHDGRLWAASGEGFGTTFCVTLPLAVNVLQ
jgi:PAS domain S-box-containing protein